MLVRTEVFSLEVVTRGVMLETALIEKRDGQCHMLGNRMQSNQLYGQNWTHNGKYESTTRAYDQIMLSTIG